MSTIEPLAGSAEGAAQHFNSLRHRARAGEDIPPSEFNDALEALKDAECNNERDMLALLAYGRFSLNLSMLHSANEEYDISIFMAEAGEALLKRLIAALEEKSDGLKGSDLTDEPDSPTIH